MGNLWLKIKVWTKTTVIVLLLVYLLLFIYINTGQEVTFWYWYKSEYKGQLLMLMLVTFLAGGLTYFMVRTILSTIGQVRELRNRKQQREVADMVKKAAKLQQSKPPGTLDVPPPPTTN